MKLAFVQRWVERRKHLRLILESRVGVLPVRRPVGWLSLTPETYTLSRNASLEGLELLADRPYPEGTALKLWVRVENQHVSMTLRLRGDVRWTLPHGTANEHVIGVYLRENPRKHKKIWADIMVEEMRMHESPMTMGPAGRSHR